jgi:hypothetical protein
VGHEALKTGLNLTSDVMEGQNVTQAAKSKLKSTGQILLQKAIIGVGRPGHRPWIFRLICVSDKIYSGVHIQWSLLIGDIQISEGLRLVGFKIPLFVPRI